MHLRNSNFHSTAKLINTENNGREIPLWNPPGSQCFSIISITIITPPLRPRISTDNSLNFMSCRLINEMFDFTLDPMRNLYTSYSIFTSFGLREISREIIIFYFRHRCLLCHWLSHKSVTFNFSEFWCFFSFLPSMKREERFVVQ